MQNTIKNLEKSQKEISVRVLDEEMQKYIEKATDEIARSMEIDGFRKGKVPKEIAMQKVGMERIYEEAAHLAIEELYLEILKKILILFLSDSLKPKLSSWHREMILSTK